MSTPIDESILRSLRRITRAIDQHSRSLANKYGLTGPQLICLIHLNRSGKLMGSELARAISLSQATVTGILDRLENRGLVDRKRSIEDKRRVFVSLTDKGSDLVATCPYPLHEIFAHRLQKLPVENQQVIDTILKQIVLMMEAGDVDGAPVLATGPILAEPQQVSDLLEQEPRRTGTTVPEPE